VTIDMTADDTPSTDPGKRIAASGAVTFPEPLEVLPVGNGFVTAGFDPAVPLSHIDRTYFPKAGYTKGDLLTYYRGIAALILPHLAGRALSLRRFPGGTDGTSFYEKRCPSTAPDWIVQAPLSTETTDDTIAYCTVSDVGSLLWIVNLGCIAMHPWLSRADHPDVPNFAVFDLDRHQGATWEQVVHIAGLLRVEIDRIGLVGYPKTSGSTGLHIFVPIESRYPYPRVKRLVEAIGAAVVTADPDNATMSHKPADKASRVLLDVNQNGRGRTMASVYSVRPTPVASVSTPVTWDELGHIAPGDFTIATIWERVDRTGDLFAGTLDGAQRIEGAEHTLGLSL
jgi:bifunctional non-homologous end joining protein LigD